MSNPLVVTSFGEAKSGRTYMALTFPRPLYFFDLNYGLGGVRDKFDFTEVERYEYSALPFADWTELKPVFERFKKEYRNVIKTASPGSTVVIDTTTELDDLIQVVTIHEWLEDHQRAKGKQVPALSYGERNNTLSGIFHAPYTKGLNAVFIHKARKQYEGDTPTGALELNGWAGACGDADMTVQTLRQGKDIFKGRITFSRFKPELEGDIIDEPNYDMLAALIA